MVYQGTGRWDPITTKVPAPFVVAGPEGWPGPGRKPSQHSTFFAKIAIFIECCDGFLLLCGTIQVPATKQQQRRGNRRHDHARPDERLLHTKRRRQPRGNRQRGHAGEHVAKAHDRVDAAELSERGRRLHDRVVERVDDAPGYAQYKAYRTKCVSR